VTREMPSDGQISAMRCERFAIERPRQPLARSYANVHVGDTGQGYGFNVDGAGLDSGGKDTMFGKVYGAGFGWVRQQVRWSSYEPTKGQFGNDYVANIDAFVNAATSAGVNVMLSPVSSPAWTGAANGGLPPNPQDFANFIGFMANRYKGKIAAYEVWNDISPYDLRHRRAVTLAE